eukprot:TRINITY_DN15223_c0_g1_i1.p1 TRINITY_DN15223_c0_g1~~TRINITY_DN15223_c0_g1_i1.p1  ORF type:complete len:212 (-),score=102.68 TRINITY_DN15223_c0_g1_i1:54-644(-)
MGQAPAKAIKKSDLEQWESKTHYDQRELKQLFKQFKKETPAGTITKAEFIEALNLMGLVDPFLQNLIFDTFDSKDDDSIDFTEFVSANSTLNRGSADERLELAFKMYDVDNTGFITKEGLTKIVESLFRLVAPLEEGPLMTFSGKRYQNPQELVEDFFEQMDADGDGKISFQDYKDGSVRNQEIITGLKLFSNSVL